MQSGYDITLALTHLKKADPTLRALIEKYPPPELHMAREHNLYEALLRTIIGQQLSVKAARSINDRFKNAFGGSYPPPETLLASSEDELRKLGLSRPKIGYVKDVALHIKDGLLPTNEEIHDLSDEEISQKLIAIKGIGKWSADMVLMFTLARPDILPTGDLAIRKGYQKAYKLSQMPTESYLEENTTHWKPFRSVASHYLYEVLDN